MKIFALLVVKNEDDIVEYTIRKALEWADYIIALDNNSSDNTYSILKKLDQEYENFIFWGRYDGSFRDWLRSLIFNDYRHLSSPGDWVGWLDADELYDIDNPRDFLGSLPPKDDLVFSAVYQYYFTEADVNLDEQIPAPERMKYFVCNHSERRFFKVKEHFNWPINRTWPFGLINPSAKRIRYKHYQYRSMEQMQKRKRVRLVANDNEQTSNVFFYETKNSTIMSSKDFIYDDGNSYQLPKEYQEKPVIKNWKDNFKNKLINILFNSKLVDKILNSKM